MKILNESSGYSRLSILIYLAKIKKRIEEKYFHYIRKKNYMRGGISLVFSSWVSVIVALSTSIIFSRESRLMGNSSVCPSTSCPFWPILPPPGRCHRSRKNLPRKSLDKLLLHRVLAFNKYIPSLGHHLLNLGFWLNNLARGGPILLSLSLQLLDLMLKCGHLILNSFCPILKGRLWSISLVQAHLELVNGLRCLLHCIFHLFDPSL